MKQKEKIISGVIVIFFIIIIDQLTKFFIADKKIDIISGVVSFRYLKNYGIAFGLGENFKIPIIIINLFIVIIISIFIIKLDLDKKVYICLFMVLGGAISNLIDRIFRGFVVDFLNIKLLKIPVFNIADIFITLGIIFLIFYCIIIMSKDIKK